MSAAPPSYTIGALAGEAGVGVETVRYYQRRGLLEAPQRAYGSIRRYGVAHLQRLAFIRSAQELGFSLDEVAQLLLLADGMACEDAQRLASRKLDVVRARRVRLQRIEKVLRELIARCDSEGGSAHCPIIEALSPERPRQPPA